MSKYALPKLSQLRLHFEKGNPYLLALGALALGLSMLVGVSAGGLWIAGKFDRLPEAIWWSFLRLSDTGYLGESTDPVMRSVGLFLWVASVFFVSSSMTAVVTNLLHTRLERLRQQGFDVPFREHTVIVGWNEKIFTLVEEIFRGNPLATVAILGPIQKDVAELELDKRVFSRMQTLSSAVANSPPRRRVVYRQGSARVAVDLQKVGADKANNFILLADDRERGLAAHVATLQAYLAPPPLTELQRGDRLIVVADQ